MTIAYASRVIDAPIDTVWATVRDFDGLPAWVPAIRDSAIEDGQPADRIGVIRKVTLADGTPGRERLTALDDAAHRLSYAFVVPPIPVENYIATIELTPITSTDQTLAVWRATFEEAPADAGRFGPMLSDQVFAPGLAMLGETLGRR